jgi:integrase
MMINNDLQPVAVNDSFFAKPRARNAPIKSSLRPVSGLPDKLKIFRIAGSKYWQVRMYNYGKYTSQSLKTTDMEEANSQAKIFFEGLEFAGEYQERYKKSEPIPEMRNQMLLHDLIQEIIDSELAKVSRDEITYGSFLMTKNRLESHIFEFFKNRSLNNVTVITLEEFVGYLTRNDLTVGTIQGYMAQLRKVLKLLNRKNILKTIPQFPQVKSQVNSRGAFTVTEYRQIMRKAHALRSQTFTDWDKDKRIWIKSNYHQMPYEMTSLIRFMVYTFVRPGDIRQIQNKHIEIIQGQYNYLRLNLPEVKRHKAATVSLPPAVNIYRHLLAYQKARGYGKPDDYVFFPEEKNRRLMLDIIGWLFNWILKDLDLKLGPHGIERTLYSLRHTAITFRLIYGGNIDLLTLARNARTSVEMIEKFYASTLSAEMNIALLHGKRR